jgi:actin-related protein 6
MIDNGAGKLKAGTCKNSTSIRNEITPMKQTNCTARMTKQMNILIGDDVDKCLNGSLLHYNRPFDRGYLVNWQCEIDIWSKLFSSNRLNVNPSESSLCVTDSPFTPEQLQNDMNEVVFEEYSFQEYLRKPAAWFSAYDYQHNPPEGTYIFDSQFS